MLKYQLQLKVPRSLIQKAVVCIRGLARSRSARKFPENTDKISNARKNELVVQGQFERIEPRDRASAFLSVLTFRHNSPIFFRESSPTESIASFLSVPFRTLGVHP